MTPVRAPGPASTVAREADARAARPRVLFLSHILPYPPDGGALVRTYNVLRLLARECEVTALCFHRAGERSPAEARAGVEALGEIARVEAFPVPREGSRAGFAADHLRSVAARRAYTVFTYASGAYRRRLGRLLETGGFDLVHVDSLDLAGYLPALGGLPVVCAHHNVESILLRRRADAERRGWARAYLRHQAGLLEGEERRWCPRVALNVAVSRDDAGALARLAPGARMAVVPNGVDTRAFSPAPGGEGGIVFVGGPGWFPNADGMRWFCADVLPLLRARGVADPVRWVGRAPEAMREEHRRLHGVEMTGYVEDVRPHLAAAACFVAPLRVGGGTRLKILDAWAMGKAVVSTTVGCEGLDARDGENILVRDDPAAFADAVRQVLADAELRVRLGAAARRTAEETYDWEVIGRAMLAEYRALLPAHRADPQPNGDGR